MKRSPDIPSIPYQPSASALPDLEIVDLRDLDQRRASFSHDPTRPHRVGFHVVMHVEAGRGKHLIDFENHAFDPGSFVFVNRSQVQAFDFSGALSGRLLLLDESFVEDIRTHTRAPVFPPVPAHAAAVPVLHPKDDTLASCQALLTEVERELGQPQPDRPLAILLVTSLLTLLDRARGAADLPPTSQYDRQRLAEFMTLLDQHLGRSRDALYYAQLLSMTPKTLNALCKQTTGRTAKQLIDDHVVLEAKRRLVLDRPPIQQLAFELGFEDPSNFGKYFKRCVGETPAEFLKRYPG